MYIDAKKNIGTAGRKHANKRAWWRGSAGTRATWMGSKGLWKESLPQEVSLKAFFSFQIDRFVWPAQTLMPRTSERARSPLNLHRLVSELKRRENNRLRVSHYRQFPAWATCNWRCASVPSCRTMTESWAAHLHPASKCHLFLDKISTRRRKKNARWGKVVERFKDTIRSECAQIWFLYVT